VVAQNVSLWCWGANEKGQLGIGVVGGNRSAPAMLTGLVDVRNVSLGDDFTCAVVGASLRVVCWGGNEYVQVELDSSTLTFGSPGAEAKLGGGSAAYETRSLACTGQSCCAIVLKAMDVEALKCWGRGNNGQLDRQGRVVSTEECGFG
jgi:alpha-tubulin suppressor-like RCC1 family protein